MIDPNYQKLRATVTFEFEAEIFPGDPNDAYQIASLEEADLRDFLTQSLRDYANLRVKVQPIITK